MLAIVDDWGNPSPTGAGTEWFGFAAIFLKESQIETMRKLYADVCKSLRRMPNTPIHTLKLQLNTKYHITKLITHLNPAISIIAVRIHEITSRTLKQRGWAYRFYAKEIVRAASHFAADNNEFAKVVFHKHDYLADFDNVLRDKIQFSYNQITASRPKQILFDRLVNVYPSDDEDELLLSFADCIAHACSLALTPDDIWHQVNPTLLDLIQDCIWEGPSYDRNPCLFGIQIRPWPPSSLIPQLPHAFRQYWGEKEPT